MKILIVLLCAGVFFLWLRVMMLEDNMFKFNQAVKTLAGGLMELKTGGK